MENIKKKISVKLINFILLVFCLDFFKFSRLLCNVHVLPRLPIYSLFPRKVIERIQKSKATVVNITCPEIQNYTFTNEEPFDILGLPECGFSVELPELKLYLDDENKTECFLGLDHLQVFWKHKSIGNQASDWLTR